MLAQASSSSWARHLAAVTRIGATSDALLPSATAAAGMATKAAGQRQWNPPPADGATANPLVLYNSLLDEKVPFVPTAGPNSKQITWYTCGPTVYDSAHMGHARNYVTFDVLRRVLEDYFGYNVLFVMNVTDVDDKIILRARRNYLMGQYRSQNKPAAEVRRQRTRASRAF